MYEQALRNKTAVVTGASRGIGQAIALAYAQAGAAVTCAARTLSEIEDTCRQIKALDRECLAMQTDVTRPESVQELFAAMAERFGGLDILVINAGANYDHKPVEESITDDWEATLQVNLVGAYYCARAAIPFLKQRGAGKIITIGSGLGHRGRPGGSAYACSKAGLWMLTRILARELLPYNISVNELIPGPVQTAIDAHLPDERPVNMGFESEWVKMPADVTNLALFLATQPDRGPTAQSFSLMRRDN